MRPQNLAASEPDADVTPVADDLGWNDMGGADTPFAAIPQVLVARAALKDGIETGPRAGRSVSPETVARIGRETVLRAHGAKVAFTLRLDAERHLRLRLAGAITNLSSQHLVTQALDSFLLSLPEVDALAAQIPPVETRLRQKGSSR